MRVKYRVLVVITGCFFASGAIAETSTPTYVHYKCSAGEKPGSPIYELTVLGNEFRVEKISAALPDQKRIRVAYGSISKKDQLELTRLVPKLAASLDTFNRPQVAYLSGLCSWSIDVGGTVASASFHNTQKLDPEFNDFLSWIRMLYAHDKDDQAIMPIIPGEDAQWFP